MTIPKTTLFLDLEETVIDSWNSRCLLMSNLEFIKQAIDNYNEYFMMFINERSEVGPIVDLGLFSYAVDDDRDLRVFIHELQQPIEYQLGLKFNDDYLLTIEKIKTLYTQTENVQFLEYRDFNLFCKNKAKTFFTVIPKLIKSEGHSSLLVDDVVPNHDLHLRDQRQWVRSRCIVPKTVMKPDGDGKLVTTKERTVRLFR